MVRIFVDERDHQLQLQFRDNPRDTSSYQVIASIGNDWVARPDFRSFGEGAYHGHSTTDDCHTVIRRYMFDSDLRGLLRLWCGGSLLIDAWFTQVRDFQSLARGEKDRIEHYVIWSRTDSLKAFSG